MKPSEADTAEAGETENERTGLELAIVGMAGRFPEADDLDQFWANLAEGRESIRWLSDAELAARGASPRSISRPGYVKAVREVNNWQSFDAAFFNISPREAEMIDPQQRLFLECCWHGLEDAGCDLERFAGVVGVYAGERMPGYLNNVYSNPDLVAQVGDLQVQLANDKDYVATRVSYKLNLGGPSVTVQTACSTALVAMHMAGQGLLSGDCDLALAGGVGVRIPEYGYQYTEGDIVSPDGKLRAFDAKAKGTMFSSGVGVVVLKRLDDAIAAGDPIRAIIKGSAITNDGASKVGFSAPAVDGQARVVRAALMTAEIDPETVSYIEAHGTGTPMGDPIEVTALTRVFRERTNKRSFCALGSVKTNIGHLGAAAGAAGIIKTVLALEHRQLPPSLNFEEGNPGCRLEESPFFVNTELKAWEANGSPRRAGVSAFGMGGTNAHVLVEEAPRRRPGGASRRWQVLALSARTESSLNLATQGLADYLERHEEINLADAAYTLATGRKAFDVRRVVAAESREDAVAALRALDRSRAATAVVAANKRPVVFLFSGQGAQYPGMGRDLYHHEPVFRAEVDRAAEILKPLLGLDLRGVLYPEGDAAQAELLLAETRLTQPALFVVEYALAKLWMEWGITPEAMAGHSVGEYVAATLAGVFTVEEALKLVAARGRLMQSCPKGSMLGVPMREAELLPLLPPTVTLATVNGPNRLVASGPDEDIDTLEKLLKERRVAASRLRTSHAFHSPMMEGILPAFVAEFAGLELKAPKIPYLSNLSGTWITAEQATDPAYWAQHLRQAVRFADNLAMLFERADRCLLEVGPGKTLATFARQHPAKPENAVIHQSLRHPKDAGDDQALLLKTFGELWASGAGVELAKLHRREERRRVSLPGYAFERQPFFIEQGDLGGLVARSKVPSKLADVADWFYAPYFKPGTPPAAWQPPDQAETWLLFADSRGLAERLAGVLAAHGQKVVTVSAGAGFRQSQVSSFEIDPSRGKDYEALLSKLQESEQLPQRILHLWNISGAPSTDPLAALPAVEARSFWSLFFFAQAVGRLGLRQPMTMGVISNNLHKVGGESYLCPQKGTLLGPVKVIPQEYPNLRCQGIDLALPADGPIDEPRLAERLIAAVTQIPAVAPIAAWRGRDCFKQAVEAVKLHAVPGDGAERERLRFKAKGVYLITGGLGGIGLTFAEFLARDFQARLVLMGFSALPPRPEWEGWIESHGGNDRISRRLAKLIDLEHMGAEVLVVTADVANQEQVEKAVAEARARFGKIDGLIHAAGLAGRGVTQLKPAETAASVLAPKTRGTWVLTRALEADQLDFIVLCSSTIAVMGGLGQIDYCAANSFLDCYAQAASRRDGPYVVSLNWGAWQDVGMAVDSGLMPGSVVSAAAKPAPLHPLLDRVVSETLTQAIYATELSTERHWVAAEHRILGTPTVPGTTYLEIARAAFEHHAAGFEQHAGLGAVEIRDVYFLGPLMLAEGEVKEIRTTLEKEGDHWSFRIASLGAVKENGEASWQAHVRGKVGLAKNDATSGRDLAALLARCSQKSVEFTGPVMMGDEGVVRWGPRWQSLKRVVMGEGEAVAVMELPEEFVAEAAAFGLHPALVDVATGIIGFLEEGSYLPLSYRRVVSRGPLPTKLWSHLTRQGDTASKETLSVDVSLLDESGREVVRIEHFSLKRVGEAVDSLRKSAEVSGQKTAASSEPSAAASEKKPASPTTEPATTDLDALGGGITPAEGVEALCRVLSLDHNFAQLAVSAKDLNLLVEQINALSSASLASRASTVKAPRAAHARPKLSTAYEAPRSPVEETLASIWAASLGVDKVGIHDNFFDLGGDSVMGIQLVARANDTGLELSPEQLFEHQTIAELAALISPEGGAMAAAPTQPSEVAEPAAAEISTEELDEVFAQLESVA